MSSDSTQRDLGRIEGKLDIILESLPAQAERISALERWKSRMTGIGSAALAVTALVSWFVGTLISLRK
jgi:hypothetical protein